MMNLLYYVKEILNQKNLMNIMNTLKNVNVLHIVKFMSKLKKLIMMANASSDDLYSNKYLTI